jgi:hypothetical protein
MFRADGRALILLCFLGMLFYGHRKTTAQSHAAEDTFAFWYEPWQPDITLKKLQPANAIVGVPATAIPEIHKNGGRALQYVTYYQTHFKTAFLNDRNDLANVGFQVNGQFLKSAFGGEDNYVLCPNSVEVKARVLRFLDSTLKQGFDGYFVDNTFLQPASQEVCTANHEHIKQAVQGGRAYLDLLAAVRAKIKQQNASAILISNPGSPPWADHIASGQPSLWDISDYVVWESYGYTSSSDVKHDRWKQTIELSFNYSAMPDKAKKVLALSYPRNAAEARFAFAIARIFGFQWTANLGEKDANTAKEGGHFGTFFNETPYAVGEPVGQLPTEGAVLLHRAFTNGEIFANTSATSQRISLARGAKVLLGDAPAQEIRARELELAPMTAAIVVQRH